MAARSERRSHPGNPATRGATPAGRSDRAWRTARAARWLCPVVDAIALIEEPFKWEKGHSGVWLSIGITGLDFAVIDAGIQEVWLPRQGASDLAEFIVEPTRSGICQLRICVYYGADLLQSHRVAAIVDGPTADVGGATSA